MKVGDMVRMNRGNPTTGIVMKIDEQYFGARQAFKIYQKIPRGHCIRGDQVDGIGPTKDGIRDRVMVLWTEDMEQTYEESTDLELLT